MAHTHSYDFRVFRIFCFGRHGIFVGSSVIVTDRILSKMKCIEVKMYEIYPQSIPKRPSDLFPAPSNLAQWQYAYHRSSRTPCLAIREKN